MNWFAFPPFFLNVRCKGDLCEVQKVFFLENNFWCDDHKTDKGYLSKICVGLQHKNRVNTTFDFYAESYFSLKSIKLGYLMLDKSMIKDINFFLNYPEDGKFLLTINFLFTNRPINIPIFNLHTHEEYEIIVQERVTFKSPEKISENKINLRGDGIDIRMVHINEKLVGLLTIRMKLFKVNEHIKKLWNIDKDLIKIGNDVIFKFYYFKNSSECIKNLKMFINNLCYLKLVDDFSDLSPAETTTLSISKFSEHLYKIFTENLFKFYFKSKFDEINENWKPFIDKFCYYVKSEMLENNLFFLIGGEFSINYYIELLSNFIFELLKQMVEKYFNNILKNNHDIFSEINDLSKIGLGKLQKNAVKDFCNSKHVYKHFSELIDREVETLDDYIKIEKVVCDYYNVLAYIFNLHYEFGKELFSYVQPIWIDNYNLRIIDGILIKFILPVNFGYIRGFNCYGIVIIMVKDIDYFIDEPDKLYCLSEVLKKKNIEEIEVVSSDDEKNNKKFKVTKYLNV